MKTLRFIGMAIIAVIMSVNFAACSSDDDDENKSDSPLVGTWMMTKSIKDGHTRIPGQNGFDSGLGLVFSANGTFYNLVENEKAEDGSTPMMRRGILWRLYIQMMKRYTVLLSHLANLLLLFHIRKVHLLVKIILLSSSK